MSWWTLDQFPRCILGRGGRCGTREVRHHPPWWKVCGVLPPKKTWMMEDIWRGGEGGGALWEMALMVQNGRCFYY
eukprot:3028421-Rhodomonas_salina.1